MCEDLPTDYISGSGLDHPWTAVRAIATRRLDYAPYLRTGQLHPNIAIRSGTPDPNLADLLESRAKLLLNWADDDGIWPDD
ncbi:MAG: hypothetical protein ACJ8R9_30390 [Steroidobacteraceae bacterium]